MKTIKLTKDHNISIDTFPTFLTTPFYTAHVDKVGDIMKISLHRKDGKKIDWKVLNMLKQDLYPDRIGIEIFPKKEDIIDTHNEYHILIMPEDYEYPFDLIKYIYES